MNNRMKRNKIEWKDDEEEEVAEKMVQRCKIK
jgi:hypothetical protein